jgi:hypothetical protein
MRISVRLIRKRLRGISRVMSVLAKTIFLIFVLVVNVPFVFGLLIATMMANDAGTDTGIFFQVGMLIFTLAYVGFIGFCLSKISHGKGGMLLGAPFVLPVLLFFISVF